MVDPAEGPRREHPGKSGDVPGQEASPARKKAEELADILEIDDPQARERLIATITSFSISSSVPFPGIVSGYEKAVEGGGKWLLEYTKDEQAHRHTMDRRQIAHQMLGQLFGFILGLIGIGGGLFLALSGAEWFGFAAFFTTLVTLVGIFVYDKRAERSSASEK